MEYHGGRATSCYAGVREKERLALESMNNVTGDHIIELFMAK